MRCTLYPLDHNEQGEINESASAQLGLSAAQSSLWQHGASSTPFYPLRPVCICFTHLVIAISCRVDAVVMIAAGIQIQDQSNGTEEMQEMIRSRSRVLDVYSGLEAIAEAERRDSAEVKPFADLSSTLLSVQSSSDSQARPK